MRQYKNKISLNKNGRGIYTLDPIMGCKSGLKNNSKGCFNDCYAARIARIYGYDFSKNVLRHFESDKHKQSIIRKIKNIDFPFIRMGNSGDPSEDWAHTLKIIKDIQGANKEVVIITRHWNKLKLGQLEELRKYNVCVNTSISAIDRDIKQGLKEYERLKPYCKSILRMVTFDFNEDNKQGKQYAEIQRQIINNYDILDTVFRCSPSNDLVKDGVINIKKSKFLGKDCYISKYNPKTYFGNCDNCLEKCGANI